MTYPTDFRECIFYSVAPRVLRDQEPTGRTVTDGLIGHAHANGSDRAYGRGHEDVWRRGVPGGRRVFWWCEHECPTAGRPRGNESLLSPWTRMVRTVSLGNHGHGPSDPAGALSHPHSRLDGSDPLGAARSAVTVRNNSFADPADLDSRGDRMPIREAPIEKSTR